MEEYEKVLDRISIDEKHRLKKRNEELETEIARLKSRLQQQAEWLVQHHKHREVR